MTTATWHRTPEYPARVESRTYWACFWLPLSSTLARTQGKGRSWPRTAAPCPGTQGPDRLRAPVPSLALPPSSVFATEQEARVLGLSTG